MSSFGENIIPIICNTLTEFFEKLLIKFKLDLIFSIPFA